MDLLFAISNFDIGILKKGNWCTRLELTIILEYVCTEEYKDVERFTILTFCIKWTNLIFYLFLKMPIALILCFYALLNCKATIRYKITRKFLVAVWRT